MKLLIGSVFIDHSRSNAWYQLQQKYLKATTNNFTHLVCSSGMSQYKQSQVIKIVNRPGQAGHILGLNTIIEHFNKHPEYDHLLLLDSDCFPIQKQWQENLVRSMKGFDVAAIARYENLDMFAHPSAFFVNRAGAKTLQFGLRPCTNLVGFSYQDTMSNVTKFFPLMRSNRLNHHPVLFGIYWDCFYHHGAGSRNLKFRLFYSYYNEDKNVSTMEETKFKELVDNPNGFMNVLLQRSIKLC